jgi:hypothetical protein
VMAGTADVLGGTPELQVISKSECISFVHLCCSLGMCCGSDALDSGSDLRLVVYP